MKVCNECDYRSRDENQEFCPYDNSKLVEQDVSIKTKNKDLPQLVFPFCGVAGIYFPVGRIEDGGTCEFSTETCLLFCAAITNVKDCDKIPYEKKRSALEYILNTNRRIVKSTIHEQTAVLFKMNTSDVITNQIVYWFASGDCPSRYTEQVFDLMALIDEEAITQCGFTRNRELWEKAVDLTHGRLVLTVEDKEDIESVGNIEGMYAIPNYKTGRILLYGCKNGKLQISGGCSRNYSYHDKKPYKVPVKRRKADCRICAENREGCFTVLKSN